jgi:hypothetical protein
MTLLRRVDAVLEPTKKAVSEMKAALDRAKGRRARHDEGSDRHGAD